MRFVFIILSAILLFACNSQKDIVKIENESSNIDSVEYILIVDEINFNSWMITNSRPMRYYSHPYYKAWNKIYVGEINSRVLNGAQIPFTELINYNYSIDYGIELDYQLYWYFIFIQKKYDVTLFAARHQYVN